MGKFVASLSSGAASVPAIRIQAGESIESDIEWRDASGSARNMSSSTVVVKVFQLPGRKLVHQATLSPASVLSIPGSTTGSWPSKTRYHVELWETAADGTVQNGHVLIEVGD